MKIKTGIIGGTGIYDLPGVEGIEKRTITTEYGDVVVNIGRVGSRQVAFLTRHGEEHSIPPGEINYRANIKAMAKLGVKQIFATACSGGLNMSYEEGDLVIIRQFVEFVKNRPASFFTGKENQGKKIAHVDLTEPYCDDLCNILLRAAKDIGIALKDNATYCCMEGPRFETKAEIKMMQALGFDLVAHTQYPEAALAREAGICYAAVGMVANMAAGIKDEHVITEDVQENMAKIFHNVQNLLIRAVELTAEDRECWCMTALEGSFA
ncbi:MAG: S-methyl-5'-thioinosine phosphorylase [Saccharofermentanales bacterium]|jgi:5'-methylthioadenosine phosphorylase